MSQEAPAWQGDDLQNPHAAPGKARRVQAMFAGIAGRYDLLNRLLSFGQDRRWRRQAVALAQLTSGGAVLDICCGTGDLALEFHHRHKNADVTGADFCPEMLEIARRKADTGAPRPSNKGLDGRNTLPIKWICCDAQTLPFADASFDCVSCAFGMRNLQAPAQGLSEAFRVLKPGGRIVVLEFSTPRLALFRWLYGVYFRWLLPLVGRLVARDRMNAYRYLPASVAAFDSRAELPPLFQQVGFRRLKVHPLSWRILLAFVAEKPVIT